VTCSLWNHSPSLLTDIWPDNFRLRPRTGFTTPPRQGDPGALSYDTASIRKWGDNLPGVLYPRRGVRQNHPIWGRCIGGCIWHSRMLEAPPMEKGILDGGETVRNRFCIREWEEAVANGGRILHSAMGVGFL
jgi:hypothetical protein